MRPLPPGRPWTAFDCQALLFDLDGVLVDSVACIRRIWERWADPRSLDVEEILRVAHGRRTIEALRLVAPDLDADAEIVALEEVEARETEGLREVPGARDLLSSLPAGSWAIVTSGTRAVAELRIRHADLPTPGLLVVADEVARGKPDPEGYLLAARRLGVPPDACVVVEDAPAGVAAGCAAGMRVIAIASTHAAEELGEADAVVPRLGSISVERRSAGLRVMLPA